MKSEPYYSPTDKMATEASFSILSMAKRVCLITGSGVSFALAAVSFWNALPALGWGVGGVALVCLGLNLADTAQYEYNDQIRNR